MSDTPEPEVIDLAAAIVADPVARTLAPDTPEYQEAVERIEAGEEAPKEDEEPPEPKPKKQKSGIEKRFSELTSERDAERTRAAALEARLAQLETDAKRTPEAFTPDPYSEAKPIVDDFDTYGEYQEALVDWKLAQKEHDATQARTIEQANKLQKEVIGTWNEREQGTKARVDGYDQLINPEFIQAFTAGPKAYASKEAMQLLLESEHGPDVLYELAEDDEKLQAFKALSAVRQVAYLARLEAQYEDEAPRKEVKVSKAPTPPRALPKGTGNSSVKDFPSTGGDFNDYLQWRAKQK